MSDHFWRWFAVAVLVLVILVVAVLIYLRATQPGGWDGCQWVPPRPNEGLGRSIQPIIPGYCA